MHITLAYAISVNGKITKGDNPDVHAWTSAEDSKHFRALRDAHQVIIIDRHTYEAMQLQPEEGRLRIVFTHTPEKYSDKAVDDQLEFVSTEPSKLVKHLEQRGYTKALLAGGGQLSSSFLAADLVDDLYVTYEPWLFGSGRPMIAESSVVNSLQLQSVKQLNDRGSLLAHYIVQKNS